MGCGTSTNENQSSQKPGIIFVVGGPGSGKGTQCANLVQKYKFEHLSTGDLLREEVSSGSEKGQELQNIMKEGGLVATRDLLGLLEAAMHKKGWGKRFLLDGFPRNEENSQVFGEVLGAKCDLLGVLFFDVDGETMRARCLGRNQGRADDNEETIKKRLNTYETETVPVIGKMKGNGNVYRCDASLAKDDVANQAYQQVDAMLAKRSPVDFTAQAQQQAPAQEEADDFPPTPEGDAKPFVLFVVGGPGSGKGTACGQLKDKYQFEHLSTGDLLRAEVASGSQKGQRLQAIMKEGGLVKTKDLLGLLKAAMINAGWGGKKFLVDGFPRNQENIDVYRQYLANDVEDKGALFFNVDGETMRARCLGRNEGRADDNEETIKKRLNTYETETIPVINNMKEGGNVKEFDASKAKEEVLESVCVVMNEMLGLNTEEAPAE